MKFIHEKGLLLIFLRRAQTLCTCPVSLIWAFFNSNLPKKLKVEIRKNNIFIDAHIPSWAALNIQREIHSKDLISQNDLTSSFDRFCFVLEIVFLLTFGYHIETITCSNYDKRLIKYVNQVCQKNSEVIFKVITLH